MECHACGVGVSDEQKFCHECGASLHGVTDSTERVEEVPTAGAGAGEDGASPAGAAGPSDPAGPGHEGPSTEETDAHAPLPDPMWAESSESGKRAAAVAAPEPPAVDGEPSAGATAPPPPSTATDTDTTTTIAATSAAPMGGPPTDDETTTTIAATSAVPTGPLPDPDAATTVTATSAAPTGPPPPDTATEPTTTLAATSVVPTGPPPDYTDAEADTPTQPTAVAGVDTGELASTAAATTVLATGGAATTDEYPAAVFDGSEHVVEHPPGREPFQIRLVFLLAFFGAVTMVMSSVADLTDIRTTRPIDGITIGATSLRDVGVNLPAAGFSGAVVMVLGGFLACFGFRWGAGLAGGAGLALAGWAGLTIGLVEVPIAVSESITRTSGLQFTLTITRDLGYWLVVAAGAIGLVVFAASLRSAGTGGRRSLNPWVAAVGAVSSVILAAGPLIPVGEDAKFADNFRSPNALIDLPTAYFGGRIGQVALIAFAGVVGFLLVRVYGLGLAAGGISVAFWLWLTSLLGIGEDLIAGEQPLGIAAGNFGSGDTEPHAVTSVGMVLMLLMLLTATVMAIVQTRRARTY